MDDRTLIERFKSHAMFRQMFGHPLIISDYASRLSPTTSLGAIYAQISVMGNVQQNLDQLKNSMQRSIAHIKNESPAAFDLFCLLGLLPDGATEAQIQTILNPKDSNIQKDLSLLMKRQIVDQIFVCGAGAKTSVKYNTKPFWEMFSVQENLRDGQGKYESQQQQIASYFNDQMLEIYEEMASKNRRPPQNVKDEIQRDEANILACIKRAMDTQSLIAKKEITSQDIFKFQNYESDTQSMQ